MAERTIRTRVWRNAVLEKENFPFEQVSDYLAEDDCLVWADLLCPTATDLDQIAEELSLDPHAIEDATGSNERPKVNRYSTHLFVTAYTLTGTGGDPEDNGLRIGRVSAFVTHRALVTVRLDDTLDIEAVVRRWDASPDLVKYGPKFLLHGLLDETVDRYFDVLQTLDQDLEGVENKLFKETNDTTAELTREIFRLRRSLMVARRVMGPMREVIGTLVHRWVEPDQAKELQPYYEDLSDHTVHAVEWTDAQRDMLSSVFDTTTSMNDDHRNEIMKKLTSWAAIVAVPTAITGWFGQNLPYPGFSEDWGVWLSIGSIVLIGVALYGLFKAKDWL